MHTSLPNYKNVTFFSEVSPIKCLQPNKLCKYLGCLMFPQITNVLSIYQRITDYITNLSCTQRFLKGHIKRVVFPLKI